MSHPITDARREVEALRAEVAELKALLPAPADVQIERTATYVKTQTPGGSIHVEQIEPDLAARPGDPEGTRRDVFGLVRRLDDGRIFNPVETHRERRIRMAKRVAELEAEDAADVARRKEGAPVKFAIRDHCGLWRGYNGKLLAMADGTLVPDRGNTSTDGRPMGGINQQFRVSDGKPVGSDEDE